MCIRDRVNNANKEPKVIPSIQEWYGYEGEFNLNSESKIIIQDDAELGIKKVVEGFQSDIKEIDVYKRQDMHHHQQDSNI